MKNNFKIVEKLQKTRKYTKKSIVKKLEKSDKSIKNRQKQGCKNTMKKQNRSRKKSLLFAKKW